MSYDIYFIHPSAPNRDDFVSYFGARRNFAVNGNQAWYSNEDTGVYFSFDLATWEERANRDRDEPDSWASFTLNFFRPSYFADEASIELQAFVERFGGRVSDPQIEEMGQSDHFSGERFLLAWKHGNRAARGLAVGAGALARPTEELHRIWQWNYSRAGRQEKLGERVFVPRIIFVRTAGRLRTASIWADAIPVVLPRTDLVIFHRDDLAPRSWFKKQVGNATAPWAEVAGRVADYRSESAPVPHYFVDFGERPRSLITWVKSLPKSDALEGVPMDQVLDEESPV